MASAQLIRQKAITPIDGSPGSSEWIVLAPQTYFNVGLAITWETDSDAEVTVEMTLDPVGTDAEKAAARYFPHPFLVNVVPSDDPRVGVDPCIAGNVFNPVTAVRLTQTAGAGYGELTVNYMVGA